MDYKKTLNLPKTEFPMKGNLPVKEPVILAQWEKQDIYRAIQATHIHGSPDGPWFFIIA